MKNNDIILLCLYGTLFVGIGCLFVPSLLDSLLPHLWLDQVLTPEELRDDELRNSTLNMLKRFRSGHTPYWIATGAALSVLSGVGLRATYKEMRRQQAS